MVSVNFKFLKMPEEEFILIVVYNISSSESNDKICL